MTGNRYAYKDVHKKACADGFQVLDARQYYHGEDTLSPHLSQIIKTPYSFEGKPVLALTDTDLKEAFRDKETGLRSTDMVEFYAVMDGRPNVPDMDNFEAMVKCRTLRNVDDMGAGRKVFDVGGGSTIAAGMAHERLRSVAAAASEYPHVMICDEYIEARSGFCGRLGLPRPTEDDYQNVYLPNVERQLSDPAFTFVGRIRSAADLGEAYESVPSVAQEMQDAFGGMGE